MNKRQKEVEAVKLEAEKAELKHLKAIYNKAAEDIAEKIRISNGKINVLLKNFDDLDDVQKSILQSQIYQRNFQQSLKKQIDGFLSDLKTDQYKSIDEYLKKSYETGFLGTMYDIHGQGIPLIMPIDQKQAAAAIKLDPKISKNLYTKLGEDVNLLKKRIANNVSRGISTASSYSVIARNIAADSNVGFNKAMRIARTEGHGVQVQAAVDAQYKAKEAGADVVKQWDAALDGRTRASHRRVDGEIRELDEPFGNGMMYPSDPAGGAAEVVNCRCALLQRARWALDEDELETLKERAAYYDLDKTKNFEDFKKKYLNAAESEAVKKTAFTPAKTIDEAEEYVKKFVDSSGFGATGISYKGISVESANAVNEALEKLYNRFNLSKLGGVYVAKGNTKLGKLIESATAAYSPIRNSLLINNKSLKDLKTVSKAMKEEREIIEKYLKDPDSFTFKTNRAEAVAKASAVSGRATVPETIEEVINHEIGHSIEKHVAKSANYDKIKANMPKYAPKISGYATSEMSEYIAESFASWLKGEKLIDPELEKVFMSLERKN